MTRRLYKKAIKIEFTLIVVLLAAILFVSIRPDGRRNPEKQTIRSTPEITSDFRTEIGFASYYDDGLHGQPTASGEPYDKYELTAAHRSFPFGTQVRVTNVENGQSIVVRINDRGPQNQERIIDLSTRAAREIGLTQTGVAKVKIEVIKGVME